MTDDRHSVTSDVERESLGFLHRAARLRGLSSTQFQRIEHRLAHTTRPNRRRHWVPALAAFCLVLIAGTAVAHVVDLSRLPILGSLFQARRQNSTPDMPRPPRQPARGLSVVASPAEVNPGATPPAGVAPASVESPEEVRPTLPSGHSPVAARAERAGAEVGRNSSLAPTSSAGRHAEPRDRGAVPNINSEARVAPRISPTAPAADPILAESQSFSAALAEWHRDRDATAALAALDIHERRFAGGQMQLEARLLRAEIYLQQGRERDGLALLDHMYLPALPRGRELQTVRGELRIKYGRCAEGRRDLDDVLAKEKTDGLGRRAARAISLCP